MRHTRGIQKSPQPDFAFNSHPETRNLFSVNSRQHNSASVLPNLITYLSPWSQHESLCLHFWRSFSKAPDTKTTIIEGFLSPDNSASQIPTRGAQRGLTMRLLSPVINGKCLQEPGYGPKLPGWPRQVGEASSDCLVATQKESTLIKNSSKMAIQEMLEKPLCICWRVRTQDFQLFIPRAILSTRLASCVFCSCSSPWVIWPPHVLLLSITRVAIKFIIQTGTLLWM